MVRFAFVLSVVLTLSACNCGGALGPCGLIGESEPNEDRDHATAYTLALPVVGCVATSTDQDWYEVTTPTDATGGYFTVKIDNVGTGQIDVTGFAASDNGQVFDAYGDNPGESVQVYFPAVSGQKYRLQVKDFSGFPAEYKYTLTTTYSQVNDTHEPNDTRATAKPMTLGVGVSGFLFAGYKMGANPAPEDYDDFFSVNLSAGDTSVTLAPSPSNLCAMVYLIDSTGAEMGSKYCDNPGQSITLNVTGTTAGAYFIRATIFQSPDSATAKGMTVPNNFVTAYTLNVTQAVP